MYDGNGNVVAHASSDKIGGRTKNTSTTQQDWINLCDYFSAGIENPSYKLSLREVVWDEENQVQSITKNKQSQVNFTRNHCNYRTVKSGDNGMSLYFNPFYTQDKGRRMKYIYANGELVAMKYDDDSYQCGLPFAIDQQGCQYFFHSCDSSSVGN